MNNQNFINDIKSYLEFIGEKSVKQATPKGLYNAVSMAAMKHLFQVWNANEEKKVSEKRACYLSAEFLLGRLINSNLLNLGLLEDCTELLQSEGVDISIFEEIEDDALGNGGLGRLAACFLDSAATHDIPLDGFGIRYKYGLFKQEIENGYQVEKADNWQAWGDPWGVRKEEDTVLVNFGDQMVKAVPYDMPVIGYDSSTINTLRLWQAEAVNDFDFNLFNLQKYDDAVREKVKAEEITAVLYPNDDTPVGKQLRLKQQYFFTSATMQTIIAQYVAQHGNDFSKFADLYAIQINDTHPVVAIPELIRLLMSNYFLHFNEAFEIVKKVFAYTNHTIMEEAMEKWDVNLFIKTLPQVYPYVVMLNDNLKRDLEEYNVSSTDFEKFAIISNNRIHMVRLAIYATHSINGVAQIHTEILKEHTLNRWYQIYPDRFNNKTNGITQRRWLALCNQELSQFITNKIGDSWIKNLSELEKMKPYAEDENVLKEFAEIKRAKKQQLCEYIWKHEGIKLDSGFIFDIQVKRFHEYKRQLLNAFSIVDTYFGLKDGRISDFYPTVYLFGAKAAPGYYRAKTILKYINEIANIVNNDPEVNKKMQVVFVQNYNVSYAEKLIPAADISEQISTAGTEASGTGNMKFMLNGAVTMGTLDGANVEIVECVGEGCNYIFGATVEDISNMSGKYNPRKLYAENERIRRVVDTLIDDTFSDCCGPAFVELYNSLLAGTSWQKADNYYVLYDLIPYCDARMKANQDYKDKIKFAKICFMNTVHAGKFSSDRTIKEYASEIWGV